MTARATPLILLVLIIGLAGCRDTLVDEPLTPRASEPASPDTSTQLEIYLKGPAELRVGETRNYRAQPVEGVATYRWSLTGGSGSIVGTPVHPTLQFYDITGVLEGPIVLTVQAFGNNSVLLGTGTKSVSILP